MDVRIGLELRGKKKSEVTELDLSNCKVRLGIMSLISYDVMGTTRYKMKCQGLI